MKSEKAKRNRERLLALDPHCHWCGRLLDAKNATLDHIEPRCNGGTDAPENLTIACGPCNINRQRTGFTLWRIRRLMGIEEDFPSKTEIDAFRKKHGRRYSKGALLSFRRKD